MNVLSEWKDQIMSPCWHLLVSNVLKDHDGQDDNDVSRDQDVSQMRCSGHAMCQTGLLRMMTPTPTLQTVIHPKSNLISDSQRE